jgi:hypothetical protein
MQTIALALRTVVVQIVRYVPCFNSKYLPVSRHQLVFSQILEVIKPRRVGAESQAGMATLKSTEAPVAHLMQMRCGVS